MSKIINRLPIFRGGNKSTAQDGDERSDAAAPSSRHSSSVLTSRSSFLSLPSGGSEQSRRDSSASQQQQSYLSCLVHGKKWRALAKFLDTEEGQGQVIVETTAAAAVKSERCEETVLHLACRYGAPLSVLERLCELNADLVCSADSRGRTPLHVAAGRRCPLLIRFLLDGSFHGRGAVRRCALSADDDGRTPLHLACRGDKDCRNDGGEKDFWVYRGKLPKELVYELCRAYPSAVNREDLEGMTPLEYAIVFEAGHDVVRLLRKASEAIWKRQKRVPSRAATSSRSTSAQSPWRGSAVAA